MSIAINTSELCQSCPINTVPESLLFMKPECNGNEVGSFACGVTLGTLSRANSLWRISASPQIAQIKRINSGEELIGVDNE